MIANGLRIFQFVKTDFPDEQVRRDLQYKNHHFRKCQGNCRKLSITLLGLGLGVMEPPVRENLGLATEVGGIKVRLGQVG